MKRIERENQRVEKVVEFESFDGQIWKSEEDCKKWEGSYEYTIKAMWDKIPKVEKSAEDYIINGCTGEDGMYIVPIRNENDVKVVNAYIDTFIDPYKYIKKRVSFEDIGKDIILVEYEYDRAGAYYGDVNEYLKSLKEKFDKALEELHEKKGA